MDGTQGVVKFFWAKSELGYEWADAHEAFERAPAIERFLVWKGNRGRREEIMVHFPDAYRAFAGTEISESGIAKFASLYGMLGGIASENGAPGVVREDAKEPKPIIKGERFSFWAKEINAMREAINLWDLAAAGNQQELEKVISWENNSVIYSRQHIDAGGHSHDKVSLIAGENYQPALMNSMNQGDVFQAAEFFVQNVVNEGLSGRVSPRLLWNDEEGELQLCLVPSTLIGAFWLQFAMAVDNRSEYLRCQHCHNWFQPTRKRSRKPQIYCSQACNMKAYRQRKKAARTDEAKI